MAVSKVGLKIIKRAVKIRLDDGEGIDDILESYPKLSDSQRDELRQEFTETKSE